MATMKRKSVKKSPAPKKLAPEAQAEAAAAASAAINPPDVAPLPELNPAPKVASDEPRLRLVEEPVEGTPYAYLVPEPGVIETDLTIAERAAIAKRLVELDGKVPRYRPRAATSAVKPEPGGSPAESPETAAELQSTGEQTMATKKVTKKVAKKSTARSGSGISPKERAKMDAVGNGAVEIMKKKKAADAAAAEAAKKKTAGARKTGLTAEELTKAAKAAKKPLSAAAAKRSEVYSDAGRITWLVKENPRRAGSGTHKRFAKYFGAKTVAEYRARGGTDGDLRWDVAHKYLKVS